MWKLFAGWCSYIASVVQVCYHCWCQAVLELIVSSHLFHLDLIPLVHIKRFVDMSFYSYCLQFATKWSFQSQICRITCINREMETFIPKGLLVTRFCFVMASLYVNPFSDFWACIQAILWTSSTESLLLIWFRSWLQSFVFSFWFTTLLGLLFRAN